MTSTRASKPTFSSPVGVFPTSVITPTMVRALDTADDDGRITCSTQTYKKLARYGLADRRGLVPRITHAGWNASALFPLPDEHKIRYSSGREPVDMGEVRYGFSGRRVEQTSMVFKAWCSCGKFRYYGEELGRRNAVKQHQIEERGTTS